MIKHKSFRSCLSILLGFALWGILLSGCELLDQSSKDIPITTKSAEALTLFLKARVAYDFNRTDDARTLLDEAIAKDPDFALAYRYRANTAISAGDWRMYMDKAKAAMDNASQGEQILIKMTLTVLTNDAEQRMQLAEELVKLYPESPRAWITLGGQYAGMKNYDTAREKYMKAIEIDPAYAPAYGSLWASYMFNDPKDFDKAEKYAMKQVNLKPDEAQVFIDLGDFYRGRNDLVKARDSYAKAAEVNSKSDVAFSKKGHANCFLGNLEEAREDYKKAAEVAITGGSKVGWMNFGTYTYIYADNYKSALDANQKVMDNLGNYGLTDEEVPGIMSNCCYIRFIMALHSGNNEEANIALEKYIKHSNEWLDQLDSPDYTRQMESFFRIYEGRLAAYEGRYDDAMAMAKASMELSKDEKNPRKFESTYRLLGTIHLMKKDYTKAMEELEKANDQAIYVKYLKGKTLEGIGEMDKANAYYNEVAKWNFNSIEYATIRNQAIEKVK